MPMRQDWPDQFKLTNEYNQLGAFEVWRRGHSGLEDVMGSYDSDPDGDGCPNPL